MTTEIYQIHDLEQTESTLSCSVSYDAAHPIFSGHFPNQPVVPGVCTMDMMKDLLQMATGKSLLLVNALQVKFLQLILPDVKPDLTMTWKEAGSDLQMTASLKAGDGFAFKMNGVYRIV